MIKIKTAAVALAFALTAVFGAALSAGATYVGGTPPTEAAPAPVAFKPGITTKITFSKILVTQGAVSMHVQWGEITGAKYAVYCIPQDSTTGKFGEWKTEVLDGAKYKPSIVVPLEKNVTYYVTVLPFTDTPTRQYGGFSEYAKFAS